MSDLILWLCGWLGWMALGVLVLAVIDDHDKPLLRAFRGHVENVPGAFYYGITIWPAVAWVFLRHYRRFTPWRPSRPGK